MFQNIIDLFNWTVFIALGEHVSFLELFGDVTGLACVYAVAKQWMWNWPVSILNAAAFAVLFFGVNLYADATLQIIFLLLSIYGWVYWVKGKKKAATRTVGLPEKLPVRYSTWKENLVLLPATIVLTVVCALVLKTYTNDTSYWFDGAILMVSVLATYLQAKKCIDSWFWWMAVDIVSVPLYFYKGLNMTGILYIVFFAICVKGLVDWVKDGRAAKKATLNPIKNFEPLTIGKNL